MCYLLPPSFFHFACHPSHPVPLTHPREKKITTRESEEKESPGRGSNKDGSLTTFRSRSQARTAKVGEAQPLLVALL